MDAGAETTRIGQVWAFDEFLRTNPYLFVGRVRDGFVDKWILLNLSDGRPYRWHEPVNSPLEGDLSSRRLI